jgi:adenosylhomocysteine nucleosidase
MSLTAILSALPEEQSGLVGLLRRPEKIRHASRDFWRGELHGRPVVLVLSRIGKVASATTAAALIERFGAARIVFTGVAGGLAPGVHVGDVVIADSFIQHDMDASPLFPKFEIPLYGQSVFHPDAALAARLADATHTALDTLRRAPGGMAFPAARVHHGLMGAGDRFVSGSAESAALRGALAAAGHAVLAVEMEGAAVAQVCQDHGVPFASVRTISDRADDTAHVDFPAFVEATASRYAREIIAAFLCSL